MVNDKNNWHEPLWCIVFETVVKQTNKTVTKLAELMADVTFATVRTEVNPCAQRAGGQVLTDGSRSIIQIQGFKSAQ